MKNFMLGILTSYVVVDLINTLFFREETRHVLKTVTSPKFANKENWK